MEESNKIKILFRIRSMETGGVQKVLLNILNNLDKNKFDITLLLNLYQGELLKDIPKSITVKYIGKGKELMNKNSLLKKIQLIIRAGTLKFYNKFPQLLYKKLKLYDQQVEIGFFHYNYDDVLNSPNRKSKKIGWMHGDIKNITINGNKKNFVAKFLKFNTMVYVSQQTMESAKSFNENIVKNAKIIYNPIDVDDITAKSEQKINIKISSSKNDSIKSFISIGRIKPGKGYQFLIEAHKKLINDGIYHKIYIIGNGEYKDELVKKVVEYNIEESFIFLGEYNNPYPLIKEADYFILPSLSEAYPLVIAESLILEKPIITTDVGGIREMMVDQENGIFIPSKNEQALYEAMKTMISDPKKGKFFVENNKKFKEIFSPVTIYKEIEKLFTK
jgi:glycosyltransferase involved in cell wall biosynthesis